MENGFYFTTWHINENYKPWDNTEEYIKDEMQFLTFKEAAECFINCKQSWMRTADVMKWDYKTWEANDSLYFAVVNKGVVLVRFELWPIPEDCDNWDDLPF